jgi:hypothetical protein
VAVVATVSLADDRRAHTQRESEMLAAVAVESLADGCHRQQGKVAAVPRAAVYRRQGGNVPGTLAESAAAAGHR